MHQQPELGYLVDVLAMGFKIVNRFGGAVKLERGYRNRAQLGREVLPFDQITQRDPIVAIQRPKKGANSAKLIYFILMRRSFALRSYKLPARKTMSTSFGQSICSR